MTGKEFREIRKYFGLKKPDWMYALGYQGNKNTMFLNCSRYENGDRPVPLYIAQYVWLLHRVATGQVVMLSPDTGLPVWPHWPHYDPHPDATMEDAP